MGVTHDGTVRCLSRGDRSLATPPDLHAGTGAVLAAIPRVYAVWYAMLPAPGSPPLPPQHQYPRPGTTPQRGRGSRPRARAGVEAVPQGAGRFSRALTHLYGHLYGRPPRLP